MSDGLDARIWRWARARREFLAQNDIVEGASTKTPYLRRPDLLDALAVAERDLYEVAQFLPAPPTDQKEVMPNHARDKERASSSRSGSSTASEGPDNATPRPAHSPAGVELKICPLEPTEQMRIDGARRLFRFEEGTTDESFSQLEWGATKNEAERVWRSMWLSATASQLVTKNGVARSGWRCFNCGKFVWDETDDEFALGIAFALGLVELPTAPVQMKYGFMECTG